MPWWENRYKTLTGQDTTKVATQPGAWWEGRYQQIRSAGLDSPPISQPTIQPVAPAVEPAPPKKAGFFQRISNFFKDVRGITPEMVGQELDKSRKKVQGVVETGKVAVTTGLKGIAETGTGVLIDFMQGPELKALSPDALIKSHEYAVDVTKKQIESGELTPQQLKESGDSLQSLKTKIEGLKKREKEQVTPSERLKERGGITQAKAQEQRREIGKKFGEPDPWSGEWLAREVIYSTPQLLASFGLGVATTIATKNPGVGLAVGLSSSFVQEAGAAYDTAINSGLNDAEAQSVAQVVGTINALIEQLPLGEYLSKLNKGTVVKKSIISKVAHWAISKAKQGILEGGTETLQEAVANAVERTYNEDKELFEGLPESGVIGFILGMMIPGDLKFSVDQKTVGDMQRESRARTPEGKLIQEAEDVADKPEAPSKLYRGQEVGALAGQAGVVFFTDTEAGAQKYAEVAKPKGGKSEVLIREVPESMSFKEVTKATYLNVIEDPKVKKEFDGISFREDDGSMNYGVFNEALSQLKGEGEIVLEPKPEAVPTEVGVEKSTLEVRKTYKENEGKVYDAMSQVFAEMEIAEAGQRIFLEDGEVVGIKSTFPDWVPEDLRSRKLFDKVLGNLVDIETLKYPDGRKTAQRALYDAVLDRVDSVSGVDTSTARSAIIEAYEQQITQKAKKPKEAVRKRPERGKREVKPKTIKVEPSRRITELADGYALTEEKIKKFEGQQDLINAQEDPKRFKELGSAIAKLEAGNKLQVQALARETGATEYAVIEALSAFIDSGKRRGKRTLNDFYDFLKVTEPAKVQKKPKKGAETLAFDASKAKQFKGSILENPEVGKIIKQSEVTKRLADILGVPIKHGKFNRRGASAIYKGGPRVIRTKVGHEIGAITHEAGHHLQRTIPELSTGRVGKYTTDLQNISKRTGYGAKKPTVEGFAEFVRLWVVDRTLAKKTAPSFSKYFEDIMTKYPEVGEVLDVTRRDFMRWNSQPATAKVLSQISMTEDKPALKERVSTTMNKITSKAFDDLHPIKRFVEIAKKEGIKVNPTEDSYVMARLMKGIGGKAETFLNHGTFGRSYLKKVGGKWKVDFKGKSLKSILNPIEGRGALDDFRAYLVAVRTTELAGRDIQTGVAIEDAVAAIKELNKKHPSFKKSAIELYNYQNQLTDYLVESHVISKDTAKAMRKANKLYVPFYRVMEGMESKGSAKKLAEATSQIKRIKGSAREIIDPLESIVKNTYALTQSADANMLGRSMAQLAEKNFKNARMFEKIDPKMAKVAEFTMSEYVDEKFASDIHEIMGGEEDKLIDIFRPSMFPPKGNVVTILEQGKKQYYEVDPELYSAIRSIEREQVNAIIRLLKIPAGWLRAGAVLSPEFIPRNPVRDQWTAFVYSETGYIPLLDMGRGMFEFFGKSDVYKLWKIAGGEQSSMVSVDRVSNQRNLKGVLESRGQKTLKYIKNPIEILRTASELMEISTRLGEMRKALDRTGSAELSAFYSREVTQDFNKLGSKIRALNMIAAFSGAQIGSVTKFHQAMKANPGRTTVKALLSMTLPSILLYAANRDDERWKEIPQWQKDLFWIVFVGDNIVRVPKPFLLGQLFGSFPERIMEFMDTKDPEYVEEFFTNFVQNNGINVIPTALQPIIEDMTNYNFFLDRPVVSKGLQGLPPRAQYHYYTSEVGKLLGGLVNKSPVKVDNYISGYTAGLGRTIVQALDKVLVGTGLVDKVTLPSPTPSDIPIIKAFVVRKPIGGAGVSVNKMYNRMDDLSKKERHIKSLLEKGNSKKAKDLATKYGLTMYYDTSRDAWYNPNARVYRRVSRYLSEIRSIQDKVKESKKLNAQEKREKLEKLDTLLTRVAKMTMEAETNMSKEKFEEFKINFDYSGL